MIAVFQTSLMSLRSSWDSSTVFRHSMCPVWELFSFVFVILWKFAVSLITFPLILIHPIRMSKLWRNSTLLTGDAQLEAGDNCTVEHEYSSHRQEWPLHLCQSSCAWAEFIGKTSCCPCNMSSTLHSNNGIQRNSNVLLFGASLADNLIHKIIVNLIQLV